MGGHWADTGRTLGERKKEKTKKLKKRKKRGATLRTNIKTRRTQDAN
jgi:hypothetical protein